MDAALLTMESRLLAWELAQACGRGELDRALSLIEKGAPLDAVFQPDLAREMPKPWPKFPMELLTGRSPLMACSSLDKWEIAQALLDAGCDPCASNQANGDLPIHWAAGSGNVDLVRTLLAKGADPRAKTKDGEDALACAAYAFSPCDETVALLLRAGASLDCLSPEAQARAKAQHESGFGPGKYTWSMGAEVEELVRSAQEKEELSKVSSGAIKAKPRAL